MRNRKRTATRTFVISAAALSLTLTLTACTGDGDNEEPAATGTEGDATATEDAGGTEESASPDAEDEPTESGSGDRGEANSFVFDAIDLAEQEAGGTAFDVEHEDRPDSEGVWEIEVAVDGEEMELLLSFDGTEVLESKSDGSLDDKERDGLDAAEVTVSDAIRTALDEVDGTFDEAELEREDDGFVWEIEIEIEHGGDDTEVYIDAVSGAVLRVDPN